MHEWALAQGVISTVLAMAKEREAREIVEVKIDRLQQIDIDIFSAALRELGGTPLEKDESEAIHFLPELAHTFIRCPQCGGPDFHERARDVDRTHKNFKVGAPDPRLATIHKWLKNVKRVQWQRAESEKVWLPQLFPSCSQNSGPPWVYWT